MNIEFSADDRAFRDEVRGFIRDNLPDDMRQKARQGREPSKDEVRAWQRRLHERGWIAPHWPREYGGTGWGPAQRYIFEEELALGEAPALNPFGLHMVGPVIYTFGRADQKERFLPRILRSDDWWCQGYSEPGSGSDLATLQTRAVPDGDDYVINGSKIWTSYAHQADWMFCLVRTDTGAKPQEGISFLLIEMTTPGIDVQPIISIDGQHHLNMVHFSAARVPIANRIGEENKGWTYAKFLLGYERTSIAEIGPSKHRLRRLKQIAATQLEDGRPLIEQESWAGRIADLEIQLLAHEFTGLRQMADEAAGKPIGAEASMLKIRGAEIRQALSELTVEAMGYYAAPYLDGEAERGRNEPAVLPDYALGATPDFLFSRAATIYGGSNEIQRNIIAKLVLGL